MTQHTSRRPPSPSDPRRCPTGAQPRGSAVGAIALAAGLAVPGLAQFPGISLYGTATAGCTGTASITASSAPVVGNAAFAITCAGAMPSAAGVCLLAAAQFSPPVIFGGAAVWVDPRFGLTVPLRMSTLGAFTLPLAIPPSPSLVGGILFGQFVWSDPGPTCSGSGFAATRGMQVQVQDCTPDTREPNNTCAQASAIAAGAPLTALICPAGDQDWYRFSVSGNVSATITMTPPSGRNFDLELRSGCTTVLAASRNGSSATETITRCLLPGTYEILVVGVSGAYSPSAPYALGVTTTLITLQPPTRIDSPPTQVLTGTRWHPVLHVTTFQTSGPWRERVTLNVSGSFTTTCSGASFSIDLADSNNPFPITIAGPVGGNPFTLTASFVASPGVTYEFGLVTGFTGGACTSFVPGTGGSAAMTISRALVCP